MNLIKTRYLLIALTVIALGAMLSSAYAEPFCFVSGIGEDAVSKLDVALDRGWMAPRIEITDPWDVTFGPDGNLYITSPAVDKVLKYDFSNSETPLSDYASVGDPLDVVFHNGEMYVQSNLNDDDKIYRRNADGTLEVYVAKVGGRDFNFGPDYNGDGADDLYWAGWFSTGKGVYVFTHQGDPGTRFDSGAPEEGCPYAVAWGPDVVGGDGISDLYAADLVRDCVVLYNGATGAYVTDIVGSTVGGLGSPYDMAIADNKIYIADMEGDPWWGAIRVYDATTGEHIKNIEGTFAPTGIAFEAAPQPVGSLQGNVVLDDYSGSKKLAPVQIDLIQGGMTAFTRIVTLDNSGNYSIAGVPAGTFNVSFSACKWLRAVVADVTVPDGGTATCNATLLNGDVDGSSEVTTTDLSVVLKNLGP